MSAASRCFHAMATTAPRARSRTPCVGHVSRIASHARRVARGDSARSHATTSGPAALGMSKVLFVEVGMGADQHGQDATKACVRACRNAIEFNSIPSIRAIVPGGYDAMKLHIQLGVPEKMVESVDLQKVRDVFPYGNIVDPVNVDVGGLLAKSGIAIPEMGDVDDEGRPNDDFVIAVASITVGY
jgi:uncharacterized protein (TIGR02058 family)